VAGRNLFADLAVEQAEPETKGINLFADNPPIDEPATDQPKDNLADEKVNQLTEEKSTFMGDAVSVVDFITAPLGLPKVSTLEVGATIGTSILAEPVAGIAGLTTLKFDDAEQAESNIKTVREAMTFIPRSKEGMNKLQKIAQILQPVGEAVERVEKATGDIAFEATDSPLAGGIATALPEAVLELTGLGFIKRIAGAGKKLTKAGKKGGKAQPIDQPKQEPDIDEVSFDEIEKSISRKKVAETAEQVKPDKQILADAQELGIILNPSAYSTNRAFIQIEQALKARPGSKLEVVEAQSIIKLGNKADELIEELGGRTDKSALDIEVREDFTKMLADLDSKATIAYDAVNQAVTPAVKIQTKATRAYLEKTLKELGGDKTLLTSAEKRLLDLINEDKTPTYGAIDRVRKDIGQGFKKSGIFKDDAEGTLKQVYKAISEDQQLAAQAFGVGEEYAAGRKLVRTRKNLEDTAKGLLGKDLANSIVPKITGASTALVKGDVSKFKKLMQSLPENRRQEVASTMLNDLFTSGARNKGSIGQGFANAVKSLNRNKAAKNILFGHLPKGAKAKFDRIGRVAIGIYGSKALENTSRTATAIIQAMDSGGLFDKILSVGSRVPVVGSPTTAIVSNLLKKTPATKAADEFLTSPSLKKALDTAALGNTQKAEKLLRLSPKFKKWLTNVSPDDAAKISTVGFIQWITEEEE